MSDYDASDSIFDIEPEAPEPEATSEETEAEIEIDTPQRSKIPATATTPFRHLTGMNIYVGARECISASWETVLMPKTVYMCS